MTEPIQRLINMGYTSVHIGKAGVSGFYVTADNWLEKRHIHGRGLSLDVAMRAILSHDDTGDLEDLLD